MFELRRTKIFDSWFKTLRDRRAAERILARLARLQFGQFGDVKYFDGIAELRIDYGPGYRVYFVKRGQTIVFLLCGGNKSTQSRDITRAKDLAQEL
jgi:putative addiction module killer protein